MKSILHLLLLTSLLAILGNQTILAQQSDQEVLKALTAEQPRDLAVRRALDYLRRQQKPDGSVGKRFPAALTAMAVMAHFAAGHPPADKEYGPWLKRSINYVLNQQTGDGYLGERDGSRMYGHGVCTLMLAEALGMPRDDELDELIRRALRKAVRVTVNAALVSKSSRDAGGWRYTPDATDSDLSLSGWQILGLHATQQVGIPVPEAVMTNAVAYALRMVDDEGHVAYQNPGDDRPALRGLALLSFVIGHQEKAAVTHRLAERILAEPLAWTGDRFYYRAYYDAVGLSRAFPAEWQKYLPVYEATLLSHQSADGSFETEGDSEANGAGPVYSTSMAVMALAVQRHVLPAYQR